MTSKNPLKTGKLINVLFTISALLICFYLICNLLIYPRMTANVLVQFPRHWFVVFIKSAYAIIMLFCLVFLRKKPDVFWLLINTSSVGVLCLLFIGMGHTSIVDIFLLEIISISLLVATNSKYFIATNNIVRTFKQATFVYVIPMIVYAVCLMVVIHFR